MDPDDAVKVLNGIAHLFTQLSSNQQQELLDLLGAMAEEESDLAQREFLEGSRRVSGLLP
ncbi:hypothetical protein [Streptomyces goshikiensis]|uniref:hypothetical protein n=1 Tax=Streptomyces goshikiensis TaxID=1942 RepID=UPI0036C1D4D6